MWCWSQSELMYLPAILAVIKESSFGKSRAAVSTASKRMIELELEISFQLEIVSYFKVLAKAKTDEKTKWKTLSLVEDDSLNLSSDNFNSTSNYDSEPRNEQSTTILEKKPCIPKFRPPSLKMNVTFFENSRLRNELGPNSKKIAELFFLTKQLNFLFFSIVRSADVQTEKGKTWPPGSLINRSIPLSAESWDKTETVVLFFFRYSDYWLWK